MAGAPMFYVKHLLRFSPPLPYVFLLPVCQRGRNPLYPHETRATPSVSRETNARLPKNARREGAPDVEFHQYRRYVWLAEDYTKQLPAC